MISPTSKTQKIILLIFLIFLFIIFTRFFSSLSFSNTKNQFLKTGNALLYPNKPVFQEFTAEKDNLNQVNVAIRNFNYWSFGKIIFELRDEYCKKIIATDKLDAFSFNYPNFTPFSFHGLFDLSGTKGKQYCVALTFIPKGSSYQEPSSLPSVVYSRADKEFSYINTGENNGEGKTYTKKTLVIKPAYGSQDYSSNIQTLNDRISQYKASFLKGTWLYIIVFSFIILSIILTILLIII